MKKLLMMLTLAIFCLNVCAQSFEQIRNKANSGDAYSQYMMGWSYANGENGVSRDYSQALSWFEKSSDKGYAASAYFIGWMYFYGEGVQKDNHEAYKWFSKAEQLGMNEAKKYLVACKNGSAPLVSKMLDSFDPKRPPILEISANTVKFVDPSENNAIDAGENCYIKFNVVNIGKGVANNCIANILTADVVSGLHLGSVKISSLAPGQSKEIQIPLSSDLNLATGTADLVIQVNEPHGFGSDPVQMSVATKQFVAPKLEIVDYAITSESGSNLKKKVPFDMQLLLQNVEHGNAEDITVDFSVPNGVILMNAENAKTKFVNLQGGASKSIVYSLIVSNDYKGTTIPVDVKVSEKYGKYAQDKHIDLQLNQTMAANKIKVEEKKNGVKDFDIQIASLTSDVDKDIPVVNSANSENTFAVIIANESYNKEAGVPFAANDGKVFAEYCKSVLGLPESNIHLSVNATLNDMRHEIGWLNTVLEKYNGKAKAIFYYAGHGIPDETSKNAYLLPVDGYGNDVNTGYPLGQVYKELGMVPSQSVTIFLDACFSGSKREGDMLASARGVALKANRGEPLGNMVVFSAAQGDETAYPYKKEGHGLFTYYLLKQLKDTKGDITLKQLGDFVIEKVSQQSIVINSKSQTPTVITSKKVAGSWQNWKLK